MEGDDLDWWLFDKEQCWKDIHELWTSWEARNGLMHHSWIWKGDKVGKGGLGLEPELVWDDGEIWSSWNTKGDGSGNQPWEAQAIGYKLKHPTGDGQEVNQ